ncbi:hypothetical protein HYH02_014222 [Chlamydomonas schloesseri]|uniref:GrpE protein homolog n=1 Tax=Chlamydomonas schloesseri TaxID=2026947 RepID=A0A835SYQ4_9CHLO|nr:hypothetical protein HYH02_014222 [Chlamydomonas schloesseri]|eukprot:KAG2428900.1 hypothetical protein HYH02_014222 [Chlamydomonas schloesseri]
MSSLLRLGAAALRTCRIEVSPLMSAQTALATSASRPILQWSRSYATDKNEKKDSGAASDQAGAGEEKPSTSGADGADASADGEPSAQELMSQLKAKEDHATKLTQQVETLTDSLKRTLAEMENLRARTAREVDVSKKFAIQGFVKSLLDVPDNLERAASVVPAEALKEDGGVPPEKLRNLLSGLLEGVRATENILLKVLKQNGVERYDAAGQPFDPNLHNALFDIPDPTKENNTVAVVTKKGYKLNDRVIRPAEVGVVRNVSS